MSYVKAVDTNTSNLLSAFQKGSIEAFSQLYDLYANVLFNYGCKLTNDRELLKDCIHDVFIKIYNKREELHNVLNFKSYLFVSLRNKLYDEMRKNNRLTERQIDDYQPVSPDDVEVDYISSEKKSWLILKFRFYWINYLLASEKLLPFTTLKNENTTIFAILWVLIISL